MSQRTVLSAAMNIMVTILYVILFVQFLFYCCPIIVRQYYYVKLSDGMLKVSVTGKVCNVAWKFYPMKFE